MLESSQLSFHIASCLQLHHINFCKFNHIQEHEHPMVDRKSLQEANQPPIDCSAILTWYMAICIKQLFHVVFWDTTFHPHTTKNILFTKSKCGIYNYKMQLYVSSMIKNDYMTNPKHHVLNVSSRINHNHISDYSLP